MRVLLGNLHVGLLGKLCSTVCGNYFKVPGLWRESFRCRRIAVGARTIFQASAAQRPLATTHRDYRHWSLVRRAKLVQFRLCAYSEVDSPFRDRSVAENLRLFEEMQAGKHAEGSLLLRAKIDMNHPNMNMRDPPMPPDLNVVALACSWH